MIVAIRPQYKRAYTLVRGYRRYMSYLTNKWVSECLVNICLTRGEDKDKVRKIRDLLMPASSHSILSGVTVSHDEVSHDPYNYEQSSIL